MRGRAGRIRCTGKNENVFNIDLSTPIYRHPKFNACTCAQSVWVYDTHTHMHTQIHTHSHRHTYMYIYKCLSLSNALEDF